MKDIGNFDEVKFASMLHHIDLKFLKTLKVSDFLREDFKLKVFFILHNTMYSTT